MSSMLQCPADLTPLVDLSVLPLRFQARAMDPIVLPPHASSSLRGAFGAALRRLVCTRPEVPECPECDTARCPYARLFAPRAAPGTVGVSGFTDLPRPYVLRAWGGEAAPGDPLTWDVTLIGSATDQLPYLVLAWREMGEAGVGRGRGRFHVEAVDALDWEGSPVHRVFRGADGVLAPGAVPLHGTDLRHPPGPGPASVRLHFRTPTELKQRGTPVTRPEFGLVWRALQLRLSTLRLGYGAGRPAVDFRAANAAADQVRLVAWETHSVRWERYSRRQDRRVPMRGFEGTATYEGDLAPFLPGLRLGELVGVGDNCTFGQGVYSLVPLPLDRGS